MQSPHIPVLLNEVISSFKSIEKGTILDCTLGYGGHSKVLLDANPNLKIIACDRDDTAINFCKEKFKDYEDRISIYKSNFANIINLIDLSDIKGILADIGVSSLQIDLDERGFGLNSSTLDMRMDKNQSFDAKELVNTYSQSELERIFVQFGELPNATTVAKKIIEARKISPITSAKELTNIIGKSNLKNRSVSIAILAFQAIRIEVNKELDELTNLLTSIKNSNINNAILTVISFHSLEDKIVKSQFKEWEKSCICPSFAIRCECGNNHCIGKIITKKPLQATDEEIKQNSRSSCAKLRSFKIERQR
ncbi:16S rRNA m4C1402 methyltransferase [Campylobacter iguaniorum]|uniref:16S rRNA (cytosine(1402)-N(4))-methyltransferase RsmH n=1 Tax=Campylobacter iguaniorum TaxID=1244531 RepID=UPI00073A0491|nr:16S rRNA (cytosine(1402)-N(4))-methyltransferase RsmH [Campylobacter iguaniorum]ALV24215.1 16S rRNA m4C1402 methyltransferase [Campylobacter iguaniorum]